MLLRIKPFPQCRNWLYMIGGLDDSVCVCVCLGVCVCVSGTCAQ